MFSKWQLGIVSGSLVLLLVLYFAFPIVPTSKGNKQQKEAIITQLVTPDRLLREGKAGVEKEFLPAIEILEEQAMNSTDPEEISENLKELSSRWFKLNQPAIAGYYAAQVAEIEQTANAWAIAGTTFTFCIQKTEDKEIRSFCSGQAQEALNKAIKLEPSELRHKVNLAIALVEAPPEDQPMAGILMLRELEAENPDNPGILYNLGRFAIQTGQYDKAIERLEKALSLDTRSDVIACMLSQAYKGAGKTEKAAEMGQRCK